MGLLTLELVEVDYLAVRGLFENGVAGTDVAEGELALPVALTCHPERILLPIVAVYSLSPLSRRR